jgi:class 3 adenylate cyclase
MNDRQNRTIICSVLFLDIVEYSRKPVAEQIAYRDRFNALLSNALQGVAPNDRVILDTGDGAAVSFLGDPEDALFMALTLRDSLAEPSPAQPDLRMRSGINLGPVKLVKDLNGRPNIIGDGINVAQRIMSFSEPGQVLVSRSYYEVVSRLSDQYSGLFHYEGSRTDKHVREHEVYAVGANSPALKRTVNPYPIHASSMHRHGRAFIKRVADATTTIRNNVRGRPRSITVLTVMTILAAAAILRGNRTEDLAAHGRVATIQAVVLPTKSTGTPVALASTAAPEVYQAPIIETPNVVSVEPAKKKAAPPAGPIVTLAISPWGEVYVDGEKRGVSPPLRTVKVTPGQHKIEIRNTGFPSHTQTIDVKSDGKIAIKHRFQ